MYNPSLPRIVIIMRQFRYLDIIAYVEKGLVLKTIYN